MDAERLNSHMVQNFPARLNRSSKLNVCDRSPHTNCRRRILGKHGRRGSPAARDSPLFLGRSDVAAIFWHAKKRRLSAPGTKPNLCPKISPTAPVLHRDQKNWRRSAKMSVPQDSPCPRWRSRRRLDLAGAAHPSLARSSLCSAASHRAQSPQSCRRRGRERIWQPMRQRRENATLLTKIRSSKIRSSQIR